jgi:hypothetical protein
MTHTGADGDGDGRRVETTTQPTRTRHTSHPPRRLRRSATRLNTTEWNGTERNGTVLSFLSWLAVYAARIPFAHSPSFSWGSLCKRAASQLQSERMEMDAIEKGRSRETPFRHKTSLGVHSSGVPTTSLLVVWRLLSADIRRASCKTAAEIASSSW